jgi:glycine betaine/proline transport system ATP-binding protein
MNNRGKTDHTIICQNIYKIFGREPNHLLRSLRDKESSDDFFARTGAVIAVRDVSFQVDTGETFVIMGLSGSGKSTLVRCISRLVEATSGEIWIDGDQVDKMDRRALQYLRRHKVAMVFQHFGNLPHKNVLDNVAYGLEIQGAKRSLRTERAMEIIELVGLGGREYNYPNELSGGMQQRVGLARALAVDPDILLFDEPFSALDPLIRRDMQDELLNLQKQVKKTIVFITHDIIEAVKLGDRVAIMKDGEFIQVGTPASVIMNPVNNYVRDFVEDVPRSKVLKASSIATPIHTIKFDQTSEADIFDNLADDQSVICLVDADNRLVGITAYDNLAITIRQVRNSTPSEPILKPGAFCNDNDSLEIVLQQLSGDNDQVIVVDNEKRVIGKITKSDALASLVPNTVD